MKKYQIIYADPPWTFKAWSEDGWDKRSKHYSRMTVADIKALPVAKLADINCCLFLWANYPLLPEALDVVTAWGFNYKTIAFNWIKRNKRANTWFWGMGYWTRANSECCLLATKGNPKRISASIHSIIDTPIEKHSKKPNEARDRIVQLMGDLPRIELFARQKVDGWDCWGNEVESDIELGLMSSLDKEVEGK